MSFYNQVDLCLQSMFLKHWTHVTGSGDCLIFNASYCSASDKDTPASAVLDLGTLVDAIHVASGAHLELLRLHIPNSGNRKVRQPSKRVRLNVAGAFALWPSVTVARDSKVTDPSTPLKPRLSRCCMQVRRPSCAKAVHLVAFDHLS